MLYSIFCPKLKLLSLTTLISLINIILFITMLIYGGIYTIKGSPLLMNKKNTLD